MTNFFSSFFYCPMFSLGHQLQIPRRPSITAHLANNLMPKKYKGKATILVSRWLKSCFCSVYFKCVHIFGILRRWAVRRRNAFNYYIAFIGMGNWYGTHSPADAHLYKKFATMANAEQQLMEEGRKCKLQNKMEHVIVPYNCKDAAELNCADCDKLWRDIILIP